MDIGAPDRMEFTLEGDEFQRFCEIFATILNSHRHDDLSSATIAIGGPDGHLNVRLRKDFSDNGAWEDQPFAQYTVTSLGLQENLAPLAPLKREDLPLPERLKEDLAFMARVTRDRLRKLV
jgi:hypothetical protein